MTDTRIVYGISCVWWDGVEKYEAGGHPGYRAFIEWMKGKCFRDRFAAKAAYEAKPGRAVQL